MSYVCRRDALDSVASIKEIFSNLMNYNELFSTNLYFVDKLFAVDDSVCMEWFASSHTHIDTKRGISAATSTSACV
jgi:hypothetical protein